MKGNPLEWVYFKRLARDAVTPKVRPELGVLLAEGEEAISNAHAIVTQSSQKGDAIIAMAKAELAKEKAFLNYVFGVDLGNLDFSQPNDVKVLIETINACIGLKQVYDRNKEIIKNSKTKKAQKGVFSYFHTYILQAFDERRTNILEKIIRRFKSNVDFGTAVREVFDEEFDSNILPRAIEKMFSSNPEYGLGDEYKNAYQDFLKGLRMLPNNKYMMQLKQTWKVDQLIDNITQSVVENSQSVGDIRDQFRKYKPGKGRRINTEIRSLISNTYTNNASGLSLENFEEAVRDMITSGLTGSIIATGENFKMTTSVASAGTVTSLGQLNGQVDGASYYNIDGSQIEKILGNSQFNNRLDAINAFNEVGNYLNRLKEGFIVYSNAKNYTLNENFTGRGGFSAGTAMSLDVLEGALSRAVDHLDELEAAILNAGDGAISSLGDTSNEVAKAIAFVLFDDWNYVGQLPTNGGQALHVLDLNGITVPLSTFLYGFGQAINQVTMSPTSFVTASITPYKYNTSDGFSYGMEFWEKNPKLGKENTMISFHFLKDFSSLVAQYL